jgi:tripartite-type tricarboxylate transporter receptor subunit TctC
MQPRCVPDAKKVFALGGLEPSIMSVQEFKNFVLREQDSWVEIVKTLGVTQD